jgi:hypothetical protein
MIVLGLDAGGRAELTWNELRQGRVHVAAVFELSPAIYSPIPIMLHRIFDLRASSTL